MNLRRSIFTLAVQSRISFYLVPAHLFTKHNEVADSLTNKLEGLKVDKNRFQQYGHCNTSIQYMNESKNSNVIKSESPTKIVSLNLELSDFGDNEIITNKSIEFITITDD